MNIFWGKRRSLLGLIVFIGVLLFWSKLVQAQSLIPLELYRQDRLKDTLSTATKTGKQEAIATSYSFIGVDACLYPTSQPQTIALNLYRNGKSGETWTAIDTKANKTGASYGLVRKEGYIYAASQPGTIPLNLYWHPQRKDYFTAASTQGVNLAKREKYVFVRVEGYVYPAGYCR